MSLFEFFFSLSCLWMALAWVPYVLERVTSRGLMGAFANPSPSQPEPAPWAQRAKAAHRVGLETFAAFAPISLYLAANSPDSTALAPFATTYFVAIVAHYIIYSLGIPILRTVAFLVASMTTAALALHALQIW